MLLLSSLVFVTVLSLVHGHGMMVDPPGRSSMWRYGFNTPVNYNDNELFCGGMGVQWQQHDGKCGECGDEYTPDRPRKNENGGLYGTGVIAKEYKSGETIDIGVMLTTNHLGTFEFTLCKLNEPHELETEECFEEHKIQLADKSGTVYHIDSQKGLVTISVILPEITCDRCVLRWHYRTGNNWGPCDDGSYEEGCGPQETFRSCADVAIH